MKRCCRLLMLFVEICAKNVKFGYLNPILGKLGVTYDLGWWLVEKPMVEFLFALTELFRYLLRFRSYEAVFAGGLCTKILPGDGRPQQPFLAKESQPHWATASFCVPSFWHIPECGGRTDGFAVAYTALAKLTLRRAVKSKDCFIHIRMTHRYAPFELNSINCVGLL